MGDFYQREPAFGQPSTEKTEFKILTTTRRIYFGGVAVGQRRVAHHRDRDEARFRAHAAIN